MDLEEKMYWDSGRWRELWKNGAKDKFQKLISDYLQNYLRGCLGLTEKDKLDGAIFLLKVAEVKPIPYVNKVHDYLDENGEIAYVSFFAVKKDDREKEITRQLYDKAEKVALSIGCNKIKVVINNSPQEEVILKENNYERSEEEYQWEIYPGIMVPCHIYTRQVMVDSSHE